MEDNYTIIVISFFGGLGFFLYGLMALSESLQRVAGKRMRYYLERSTKTTLRGVFSGALFTALIQSSSGTTVLVIGLLNAGLITLRQAAGLIIGSNIGTVITGFIIGIKLSNYSLIFVALGMLLRMIGQDKLRKEYGRAIFGFGILFFGMNLMGESMYPLRDSAYFNQALKILEQNAFLGLTVGALLTALVQSSSAMIGILQEMFNQQVITIQQLVPILFGTAIGTTITAGLASLNGGVAAKRAALFHVFLNLGGAMLYMPLFLSGAYLYAVEYLYSGFVGNWATLDPKMKIATLNLAFKAGYALVFIPLIGILVTAVRTLVKEEADANGLFAISLDSSLLQSPDLAIQNVYSEILRMARLARESLVTAMAVLNANQRTLASLEQRAEKIENTIDEMRDKIRDYTVQIQGERNGENRDMLDTFFIFDSIKMLERIGDYANNINKAFAYKRNNQVFLPEFFYDRINYLGEVVIDSMNKAVEIMETRNPELLKSLQENRLAVLKVEKEFKTINVKQFSYYENVMLINYVIKNILDNLVKAQIGIEEIVSQFVQNQSRQ